MRNSQTNPLTWLAVALVVAIVLMAAFGALNMATIGGYYGMMGGGMGWGVLFMGVPAIILIVILVAALGGLTDRRATAWPADVRSPPGWTPSAPARRRSHR